MVEGSVNIVLIDQQQLFIAGIKQVFDKEPMFNICLTGDDFSVIDAYTTKYLHIDVLLIDVIIFAKNKDRIKHMLHIYPELKIIVMSQSGHEEYVTDAVRFGVQGYIIREMDIASFVEAIKMVTIGNTYIYPTMTNELVKAYRYLLNDDPEETNMKCPLHLCTKRECEVLQLLAKGQSNREIAHTLEISEKTVKNHVSSLLRKMKVNDRTQAVVMAIRNQWVAL